jgi:hypothetical protein
MEPVGTTKRSANVPVTEDPKVFSDTIRNEFLKQFLDVSLEAADHQYEAWAVLR